MVRPAHTLIQFSGVFGSAAAPQEEWQFGLRSSSTDVVSEQQLFQLAQTCSTQYDGNINPLMSDNVVLTEVSCKAYGADGKQARNADGSWRQGGVLVNLPGARGPINAPTQNALVASLGTNRSGPSGKGRIYLPLPGFVPGFDRLLSIADVTATAFGVAALIQGINGADGFGGVAVVSEKGFISPVTTVRVGRVIDTHRSRRSRRDEGYFTTTV